APSARIGAKITVHAIPWFETRRFATLLTMRDRYDGRRIDLILRAAEGRISKDRGRSLRCWAYFSAYVSARGRLRSAHRAEAALEAAGLHERRGAAHEPRAAPRRG